MNVTEFKNRIKTRDVGDNETFLSVIVGSCKYGQHYQNTTNTLENMLNSFVVTYYPLYELDQKFKDRKMIDVFTGKEY